MERRKSNGLVILALALLTFAAVAKWRTTFGDSHPKTGRPLDSLVADGESVFIGYDARADMLTVTKMDGVFLCLTPTTAVTADTLARIKADKTPRLIVVRHSLPPSP